VSRLLRLYPPAWREGYGDEFLALLADRPPSVRESVDIVRGAIDARLDPQLPRTRGSTDRRFVAPLVGAVLFGAAWLIALNGPVRIDAYGTYRDGAAAMRFWLTSMLLLAVGFVSIVNRLPGRARVGRGAAVVAALEALTWSFGPWVMAAAIAMLGATVVLAVAGLRYAHWPRFTSMALAVVAATPAGYLAWTLTQPWYVNRISDPTLLVVSMVSIGAVWPILAVILARTPRLSARETATVAEAAA